MDKEEIIKGNVLIAEFLGWKKESEPSIFYSMQGQLVKTVGDFSFHRSWNDLMLVVEEIEDLEQSRYGFTMDVYNVEVTDYKENVQIVDVDRYEHEPRIDYLWAAIVQFLEWYKTHNQ